MKSIATAFAAGLLAALAGCAHTPSGPTVTVMPAPYKPFELFMADDTVCRDFARGRIGDAAAQADSEAVGTAVVGAAVGAAAGAAIGGSTRSAATGAGIGTVVGSAEGAAGADRSSRGLQRRYDVAYQQCMYAKGNQVPGWAPVAIPAPPPPPSAPPPRK